MAAAIASASSHLRPPNPPNGAVSIEALTAQLGLTRSGYLQKLSTSETAGTFWKKRFVVLAGDTLFLYRNHQGRAGDLVGLMRLDGSSQTLPSEHGVAIFNVRTLHVPVDPVHEQDDFDPRDYRTWALQAESRDLMAKWMTDIERTVSLIRRRRSGKRPDVESVGQLALGDYQPAGTMKVAAAMGHEDPGNNDASVIAHSKVAAFLASLSFADRPPPPDEFLEALRERSAAMAEAPDPDAARAASVASLPISSASMTDHSADSIPSPMSGSLAFGAGIRPRPVPIPPVRTVSTPRVAQGPSLGGAGASSSAGNLGLARFPTDERYAQQQPAFSDLRGGNSNANGAGAYPSWRARN
ncbi:hypothetical protein HK405_010998 [Cladochytrium tenue]|nr:hypothetical protein HK405_010998 [Cladochytrium tenue]